MKRILILMLFLASSVLASENDYFFEVDTPVMVDAYFNVFNAMASIFSSDSYYDILKLAFLMGGFFVFAGGIIATIGQGSSPTSGTTTVIGFTKYYVAATALLVLLFSVKSTMWVTTTDIPSYCSDSTASPTAGQAVEMPSVLAFTFSSANLLGRELTDLAESAFSDVSGAPTMSNQGGFAGGVKNVIKVLSLENPNEISGLDFMTAGQLFFSKCVYEVSANKGREGIERINEMENAKNLKEWTKTFLETPFTGTTKKPGESLVDLGGQTMTCQNLYDIDLVPAMTALESNIGCGMKYANGGTVSLILGYGSGPGASDLQGIAVQAGLINALTNAKKISSIGIQSGYATGTSKVGSNIENKASADYMAEMLPYVQMTMRAILYGFFPFVFVIVILPGGLGVLKSYGQTLAWIELWGPTAAVVNMFVNLQTEADVSGKYSEAGLTAVNSINMISDASTVAGVASMLYLSIPALTWLILKGSGQMLGNVTSGISSKFGSNLSTQAINQDAQGYESQKRANAALKEAGIDKVVSFGEAQHYQARAMGATGGAAIGQQMISGLDTVADASTQSEGAKLKSAENIKNYLGNDNYTDQEARDKLRKVVSTGKEQEIIGANTKEGAIQAGTIEGISSSKNFTETKKHLNQTGIYAENGGFNEKRFDDLSTTEAGKKTIGAMANNSTIKQVMKTNGGDLKEALKTVGTVQSANEFGKVIADKTKQETTGEVGKNGEIQTGVVEDVNKAVGAKQAFDIDTARTEMQRMDVLDGDSNINKDNFDKWADSKAGQAYMSNKSHMKEVDEIQKDMGFKTKKQAENFKAAIMAKEGVTKTKTDHKVQKQFTDEQRARIDSATKSQDYLTKMSEYKTLGIANDDLSYNRKTGEQYGVTEGNFEALKKTATTQMYSELQKANPGSSIAEISKKFGGVAGKEDALKRRVDENVQNKKSVEARIGSEAGEKTGKVEFNEQQANIAKQTVDEQKSQISDKLKEAKSGPNSYEKVKALFSNLSKQNIKNGDVTAAYMKESQKYFKKRESYQKQFLEKNEERLEKLNTAKDHIQGLASKKGISKTERQAYEKTLGTLNKEISDIKETNDSFISADDLSAQQTQKLLNDGYLTKVAGSVVTRDTLNELSNADKKEELINSQNYIANRKGQELELVNFSGDEWKVTNDMNNEFKTDLKKSSRGLSYTGKFNYDVSYAASHATNGRYDKEMAIGSTAIKTVGNIGAVVTGRKALKLLDSAKAPTYTQTRGDVIRNNSVPAATKASKPSNAGGEVKKAAKVWKEGY